MKIRNKVKINFIKYNYWYKYCKVFSHKQTKLLFTKTIEILEIDVSVKKLIDIELYLYLNIHKNMFLNSFNKIKKEINLSIWKNVDWDSFAIFLFISFQTGVYFKNKRQGVENIFINNDIFELNIKKKLNWNNFSKSLVILSKDHNKYLIKILKEVK